MGTPGDAQRSGRAARAKRAARVGEGAIPWTRIFDPSPPLYLNVGVLGCVLLVIHVLGYGSMPAEYRFGTDLVVVERTTGPGGFTRLDPESPPPGVGASTPARYRAEITMESVRGQLPHHAQPASAFERVTDVRLSRVPLGGSRLAAHVGVFRWERGAWMDASAQESADVCLWLSRSFLTGEPELTGLTTVQRGGRNAAELVRAGGGETIRGSMRRATVYVASMTAYWCGLALIALGIPGALLNARLTRRLRKVIGRVCPECRYSLEGQIGAGHNPDRTCPECGVAVRPLLCTARKRLRLRAGERGAKRAVRLLFMPD